MIEICKIKIIILVVLLFPLTGITLIKAQEGSDCKSNSSISHDATLKGDYKDAYLPWKAVIKECPTLYPCTFADGYKILKSLLSQISDKNSAQYENYFNELMGVHDLYIKYASDSLSSNSVLSTVGNALGTKAVDYINYAPHKNVDLAYRWLSQSVNDVKTQSDGNVLFYFLQLSYDKLKADTIHKQQFMKDYMMASKYDGSSLEVIADDSIKLNSIRKERAKWAYTVATIYVSENKLPEARRYCQKAISLDKNYGNPYILMANLYAMNSIWSKESALNKCTYFLILDKLKCAIKVDPSVAEEADEWISLYSSRTPQPKDLFLLGYRPGDRIVIGGWIGESTMIR